MIFWFLIFIINRELVQINAKNHFSILILIYINYLFNLIPQYRRAPLSSAFSVLLPWSWRLDEKIYLIYYLNILFFLIMRNL